MNCTIEQVAAVERPLAQLRQAGGQNREDMRAGRGRGPSAIASGWSTPLARFWSSAALSRGSACVERLSRHLGASPTLQRWLAPLQVSQGGPSIEAQDERMSRLITVVFELVVRRITPTSSTTPRCDRPRRNLSMWECTRAMNGSRPGR